MVKRRFVRGSDKFISSIIKPEIQHSASGGQMSEDGARWHGVWWEAHL
jgi:hypothetical protein